MRNCIEIKIHKRTYYLMVSGVADQETWEKCLFLKGYGSQKDRIQCG
jgi:hypothetical protein